jgi:hypothetical protein
MIHSQLSDNEKEDLLAMAVANKHQPLITYINNLLREKSLGYDGCARPIASRDKKHMKQQCFALGYIEKIEDYLNESLQRMEPMRAIAETKTYITKMKAEIKKYFV